MLQMIVFHIKEERPCNGLTFCLPSSSLAVCLAVIFSMLSLPTLIEINPPFLRAIILQPKAFISKISRSELNFTQLKPPTDRLKNPTNISIAFASSGWRLSRLKPHAWHNDGNEPNALNSQTAQFLADIDIFSTVSGSGLAVGYYLSHYLDGQKQHKTFHLDKHIQHLLRQDHRRGRPNLLRQNLDPFLFTGPNHGSIQLQKSIWRTVFYWQKS